MKNKINTNVISCKSIRKSNGVVYSSRNYNLNGNQLKIARKVYDYLIKSKRKIKKDLKFFNSKIFEAELLKLGVNKIDYLEIFNKKSLKKPKKSSDSFNIFIAYYLKKVRLIDNN